MDIKTCTPPGPKVGDVVWFSFVVDVFIGRQYWVTNTVPLEFIRVGRLAPDLLPGFDMEEEDLDPADRIDFGQQVELGESSDHYLLNAFSLRVIEGDYPMFDASTQSKAKGKAKLNDTAQEPAANEFRFGPDDADMYRTARNLQIEHSLEQMNRAAELRRKINLASAAEAGAEEAEVIEEVDDSGVESGKETKDVDPPVSLKIRTLCSVLTIVVFLQVDSGQSSSTLVTDTTLDDLTPPPPSPEAKPVEEAASKKSPIKPQTRKRRASTERPSHATDSGTRPFREHRPVTKGRQ